MYVRARLGRARGRARPHPSPSSQEYVEFIHTMRSTDQQTILVRYSHLDAHDTTLASVITGEYIRCVQRGARQGAQDTSLPTPA